MRKFPVNLLGAAALIAAGVALLRQAGPRPDGNASGWSDEVPPGEKVPGKVRLDRLRELGI